MQVYEAFSMRYSHLSSALQLIYFVHMLTYLFLALLLHNNLDIAPNIKRYACELVRSYGHIPQLVLLRTFYVQFEYYHDEAPMWRAVHVQVALDDETIEVQSQDLTVAIDIDVDMSSASEIGLSPGHLLSAMPVPQASTLKQAAPPQLTAMWENLYLLHIVSCLIGASALVSESGMASSTAELNTPSSS